MHKNYEETDGYFYMLQFKTSIKFGITTRLVETRRKEHQKKYSHSWFREIDVKYFRIFSQAILIEKLLKEMLKRYREEGKQEWLDSRFTVRDMLHSYNLAFQVVTSAYAACSPAEWDMLVCKPITDINLNRMIDRACEDLERPLIVYAEEEKESFLIGPDDIHDETVDDYVLEHLTDEEAYDEYPWIRYGATKFKGDSYEDTLT